MNDIFAKNNVKNYIIQPMQDLGWRPPKDANMDVVIGYYVADLKGFTADILKAAFEEIRQAKTGFPGWPGPGEFIAVCRRLNSEIGAAENQSPDARAMNRTRKAMVFAHGELNKMGQRPWAEGWARFARKYLTIVALDQLRKGKEPDVKITESLIEKWKAKAEERQTEWAKIRRVSPMKTAGDVARKVTAQTEKHGGNYTEEIAEIYTGEGEPITLEDMERQDREMEGSAA